MTLTLEQRQTPVWAYIVESLEARIRQLQAELERPSMDFNQTLVTRGRIAELRGILIAGEDTPVVEKPVHYQF